MTEHPLDNPELAEHAAEIRRLSTRVVLDVIEIGRHLMVVRDLLRDEGLWVDWLKTEFRWSVASAYNYISLCQLSARFPTVGNVDLDFRALYMLAAPSTPDAVREEVIARAEAGEKLTNGDVKTAIAKAKPEPEPVETATFTRPLAHSPAALQDAVTGELSRRTGIERCWFGVLAKWLYGHEQAVAEITAFPLATDAAKLDAMEAALRTLPGVYRVVRITSGVFGRERDLRQQTRALIAMNAVVFESQPLGRGGWAKLDEAEPAGEPEPTAIVRTEPEPKPRHGINQAVPPLFKSEDRLDAFCDAVTTQAAKRFISLDQQLDLAKDIIKRRIRAHHIPQYVSQWVREAARQQGKIDELERDNLYKDVPGYEIRDQVAEAKSSARALTGALLKLEDLWKKFPHHPFFGDLGHTLDDIINMIRQYRRAAGEHSADKDERKLAKLQELERKTKQQEGVITELRRELEDREKPAKTAAADQAKGGAR